jgi:FkbM family methyltransferase
MYSLPGGGPAQPDYVRCGSTVHFLTWPRLLAWCVGLTLAVVGLTSYQDLPLSSSSSRGGTLDLPASLLRDPSSSLSASPPDAARRASLKRTLKPGEVMRGFCASRASTYYLSKWRLAFLGGDGLPSDGEAADHCDWLAATTTQVPFKMCTFDRKVDTQISTWLHKDGVWNGWKKGVVEEMLPTLSHGTPGGGTAPIVGRTLVIDVGANIGFFTLLAATRGYDVIALEPSRDAVIRLLYSLSANGIRAAHKGADAAGRVGPLRKPIVHVFNNAASDSYASATLDFIKDNPGASYVTMGAGGGGANQQAVTTVFLDDLVVAPAEGAKAGAAAGGKGAAGGGSGGGGGGGGNAVTPSIDPTNVRLIKISAEGMDSRVLAGMRRLLSVGGVPFVIFVYNDAHVRNHGCDPSELVASLISAGYRLWHAGTWFKRQVDVERFVKGMTVRSTELLFVGPDTPWT